MKKIVMFTDGEYEIFKREIVYAFLILFDKLRKEGTTFFSQKEGDNTLMSAERSYRTNIERKLDG